MTDFDPIWRTQDEIRTVVNAVLGECIWNLSYNEHRMGIELELTQYLEEETADMLINQFPVAADYDAWVVMARNSSFTHNGTKREPHC